jgi:hypothetical protein
MIKDLEKEIRDLKKELANVEKDQAALRIQPCSGDSEIKEKDSKIDGLAGRAAILRDTIRDQTRKLQLLMSEPALSCREPSKNAIVPGKK